MSVVSVVSRSVGLLSVPLSKLFCKSGKNGAWYVKFAKYHFLLKLRALDVIISLSGGHKL